MKPTFWKFSDQWRVGLHDVFPSFLGEGGVVPVPSKWAPKGVWVLQGLSPSLPAHPSIAPPRRLREGPLRGGQGVRGSCLVPWGLWGRALGDACTCGCLPLCRGKLVLRVCLGPQ